MKSKRIAELTLYFCFLAPALLFGYNYVVEYLKGETFFVETHEPITAKDMPTFTFCVGWTLIEIGNMTKDMRARVENGDYVKTINALVTFGNHTHTLTLKKNTIRTYGLEMKFEHFSSYYTLQNNMFSPIIENCLRITSKPSQDSEDVHDIANNFKMTLMHPLSKPVPSKQNLIITSQENSYGRGQNQWFDGEAEVVQMPPKQAKRTFLKIVDITEFRYLESTCQQESYYQCLANNFVNFDFERFRKTHSYRCKGWNKTCSPVSLPFRDNKKLPICKTQREKKCYVQALEIQRSRQNEHCKKTCQVKEYKVFVKQGALDAAHFFANVIFKLADSSRGQITKTPRKTIKQEHYILSGLSFLGNIGGILGIFVGFSILGTTEWITSVLEALLQKFKITPYHRN